MKRAVAVSSEEAPHVPHPGFERDRTRLLGSLSVDLPERRTEGVQIGADKIEARSHFTTGWVSMIFASSIGFQKPGCARSRWCCRREVEETEQREPRIDVCVIVDSSLAL